MGALASERPMRCAALRCAAGRPTLDTDTAAGERARTTHAVTTTQRTTRGPPRFGVASRRQRKAPHTVPTSWICHGGNNQRRTTGGVFA